MKDNNNKFESNKKYFTICIYSLFVILVGTLIVKLVISWNHAVAAFQDFIGAFSPFLIGAFIAYLINPLMKYFDIKIFLGLLKFKSHRKSKYCALALSYVLVLGVLYICFSYLIPQLYTSLSDLIQSIPLFYDKLYTFLNSLETNYPNIDFEYVNKVLDQALPNLVDILKNFAANAIPLIYNTSVYVIKWLLNIVIAIIVSIYMLSDKAILIKNFKRCVYAFFPSDFTTSFMQTLSECNKIFSGYIIGKLIDSLIVGIIAFILMTIFRMPYALIISAFVGVSNMIPYFGPFIGAVPGTIILLLINPLTALGFVVLIFLLQQFDGLYLDPLILHNSTGLKPLWIIFAITLGGSLAGVLGMFFGVPIVAVIAYLANKIIDRRLKLKNISIDD
jgi:predicted PurR-regulated permease PerM